jgi:hypothetical protein
MPRPERPLDPEGGPVQRFAAELRAVRAKAGSPTYLRMARQTGRSRTALAEAAGGDHLATWETVEAYLSACGQDSAGWRDRWEAVRLHLDGARSGAAPSVADAPAAPAAPAPPGPAVLGWWGRPRSRMLLAAAGLVVAAGAAALWPSEPAAGNPSRLVATASPLGAGAPAVVVVVVQNMVASGAQGFFEDSTPAYLSKLPEPYCAENGCEVAGTKMDTGTPLRALCQERGAQMTNANTSSAGIAHNVHAATSDRWYEAETSNGTTGLISEVYLTPASRGGLGLPTCSAAAPGAAPGT